MQGVKSEQARKEARAVGRGVWVAIVAGVVAAGVVAIWPQYAHRALVALNYVWLAAMFYMSPRGPKGWPTMTLSRLHQKIRDEGYRTPFPVALLLLASIVLSGYLMFDPA